MEVKTTKPSPFSFVNAVNSGNDITRNTAEPANINDYNVFLTNRAFSMFIDTVLNAAEMDINNQLAKQLQFDYYLNSIKPKKRFTPWPKKTNNDNLKLIQQVYGVNYRRAAEIAELLSDDQINALKERTKTGG